METIHIKLTAGSIGVSLDALKGLTRKSHAHLSDEDWELVQKVKDERFPPAKPKAEKPASD